LAYGISKASVEYLVRIASGWLNNTNTRVLSIAPYAFASEMSDKVATIVSAPEGALSAFNPLFNRVGNPIHIAHAVEAIWNGSSGWKTGDVFLIDNDATFSAQEAYKQMLKGSFPPSINPSKIFDVTGNKKYRFEDNVNEIYHERFLKQIQKKLIKNEEKRAKKEAKEVKLVKEINEKKNKDTASTSKDL